MENKLAAIGIIVTSIGQEHLFTFLLSSPMTARTIAKEKGQIEEVKRDLNIALVMSIGLGLVTAITLKSSIIGVFSLGFAILMYLIYQWRGELNAV